jgi:DNA-binding response OmpR family regulator
MRTEIAEGPNIIQVPFLRVTMASRLVAPPLASTRMPRVSIVSEESEQAEQLRAGLAQKGFDCLIVANTDRAIGQIAGQSPEIMLLDTDGTAVGSDAWELTQRIKQEMGIPLVVLVTREKLNGFDSTDGIDDFVLKPWDAAEIAVRLRRILRQKRSLESEDTIRCGDLVIDSAKCEVSLGGRPIVLTFKEYQLLKFLVSNRGRVFTREALLNKVWGWDYYGGDRTVDVHIRRLRSKIEDMNHYFIQTIRNIGYRFAEPRA